VLPLFQLNRLVLLLSLPRLVPLLDPDLVGISGLLIN
jgi:hypothetical protein